jgi:hypothetical protein
MRGRIMNESHSYHYHDNPKYTKIEKLIEILQETFGFDKAPEENKSEKPKNVVED